MSHNGGWGCIGEKLRAKKIYHLIIFAMVNLIFMRYFLRCVSSGEIQIFVSHDCVTRVIFSVGSVTTHGVNVSATLAGSLI